MKTSSKFIIALHCGRINESSSPIPLSESEKVKKKKIDILRKKKGRSVCMVYNTPSRKGLAVVNL